MHENKSAPCTLGVAAVRQTREAKFIFALISCTLVVLCLREFPGSSPTLFVDERDTGMNNTNGIAKKEEKGHLDSQDLPEGGDEGFWVEKGPPAVNTDILVAEEQTLVNKELLCLADDGSQVKLRGTPEYEQQTEVTEKEILVKEAPVVRELSLTERKREMCIKPISEEDPPGMNDAEETKVDHMSITTSGQHLSVITGSDTGLFSEMTAISPPLMPRSFWGVVTNPAFLPCGPGHRYHLITVSPEAAGLVTSRSDGEALSDKMKQLQDKLNVARIPNDENDQIKWRIDQALGSMKQ